MRVTFQRCTENKPMYEDNIGDCQKTINKMIGFFQEFANENEIDERSYQVNTFILGHGVRKTHRRLAQFEVFHDTFDSSRLPSELKEAAILAFWIVKLKPFTILVERPDEANLDHKFLNEPVNEKFARALIFSAIEKTAEKINKKVKFDEKLRESIDYAFRYWDFTKESFILFVDSLYYQSGIITDSTE